MDDDEREEVLAFAISALLGIVACVTALKTIIIILGS